MILNKITKNNKSKTGHRIKKVSDIFDSVSHNYFIISLNTLNII